MLPFPAAASLKVQRNRRHGASSLVINPPAIIYLDWDWDGFTQSHDSLASTVHCNWPLSFTPIVLPTGSSSFVLCKLCCPS
ncbi:hypothetical protein GW17_00002413 [Ensete ventricosum]|nr:hypothetical protein GW17_00002413 [Ensete ventricosum]